jgi:Uma2 family endonuclease
MRVEFDMSTQAGLVTVAEFLRLPDPKEGHYELHHGEVVLVTRPKSRHHRTARRIRILLEALAEDIGVVDTEWAFQPTPEYELWAADVALVTSERDARTDDDEYLQGAPDIVVEVLSPSNTSLEMNERMKICLENGCRSFWVVDPVAESVSVTEGKITRHYGIDASFRCDVLNATVTVREFFE